jgi:aspartate kinase
MIPKITYDEMLEMASLGAQVMQSRSIELAKKFNIPIHVRSSFTNREGTMITKEKEAMEGAVITGVTLNTHEAKCTIRDVPDKPGIAAKIFGAISQKGVDVDMIVQNISRTKMTDLSFTIKRTDLIKATKATKEIAREIGAGDVIFDKDIARVSIVGVGMKSHPGVAAKMFQALAEEKINIEMISTSEISISCIVKKKQGKDAVKVIHKKFGLDK